MGRAQRLTPTMSSRKLLALDFIKRYFVRWGYSPSLDEVGAELGVTKQRARELVQQLCDEDLVQRVVGKKRGIVLIDRGEQISEAEMLLRLRRLGWRVPLSKATLPILPELDHDPAWDIGVGVDDSETNGAGRTG